MPKKKYKIMLIEDEKDLAEIFAMKLEVDGFAAPVVIDSAKALEDIRKEKPDLILLDLVMPDVDGWQILRQIKQEPALSKIPIYAWSNITMKKKINEAEKLGISGYILKSDYTPSTLSAKVKEILKIHPVK